MRAPSRFPDVSDWHRSAIAGRAVTYHEIEPQIGYFQAKLVKGGPWVEARIYLHQVVDDAGELVEPESLECEIAGEARDAFREWPYLAKNPIDEARWRYLRDSRLWAQRNAPDEPAARPRTPIDHLRTPLLF